MEIDKSFIKPSVLMIILMVGIAVGVYYLKTMNDLVLKVEQLGNIRGNQTLDSLEATEKDILGNLTDHRIIQNHTRDNTHQEHQDIKNMLRNQT